MQMLIALRRVTGLLCAAGAILPWLAVASPPVHRWLIEATDVRDDLSTERRAQINAMLNANRDQTARRGSVNPSASAPIAMSLEWPLAATTTFFGFDYHGVSNFVDHDPRFPGFVQDYACGSRTYDDATGYNHAGTDYFLWPFPWLMMDQEQVAVVAAAPGQILGTTDGNFDRSCTLGTGEWNAVYVLHADNTVAWYGHLKSGTVTTKPVGAPIEVGEFLGFVGSSGSSTAPHLHFELHASDGSVVDPRHGACNASADLWAIAQGYEEPAINSLSTHTAEPQSASCGVINGQNVEETPAYRDFFRPGETFWVFASYHDQRNGEITEFTITDPNGQVWQSWDFDLAGESLPSPFYSGTGWDWSFTLSAQAPLGRWTVEALFQGKHVQENFIVTDTPPADVSGVGRKRLIPIPPLDGCHHSQGPRPLRCKAENAR